MDFKPSSRTTGAKYGKNKGRGQLQSFYDPPSTTTTVLPSSRRFPISPSSTGADQQDRIAPIPADPPSPSRIVPPRPAHVTSHSRSSVATSHGSQSVSPARQNNEFSFDAEMATYDLEESDEELEVLERRPIKRLRVSPVEKVEKVEKRIASKTVPKPLPKVEKKGRVVMAKKPENVSARSSQESLNIRHGSTKNGSRATSKPTSEVIPRPPAEKSELKPESVKAAHQANSKESIMSNKSDVGMAPQPRPAPPKSRTKLKSRTAGSSTPKKVTQPVNDSDTSAASPSQLGFDHLRLTTGGSPDPSATLEPPAVFPVSTLPRGRKRLIDRLDAAATQQPVRADVAATNFAKELDRLHHGTQKEKSLPISEAPKLSRAGSSQTRQTYGRAKNTYAKERSHLSDMVDELDATSTNSSQDPSQQFLSGMLTGPSQIQSQLELESDSSEDAPSYKLPSIHELKQAGTNSRLEKEVEDLLVDVNPTSDRKALRIQALMQIMRKMSQGRFATYLSEYALDRFTVWSPLMKDKISKLLLGMVFWRLTSCTAASPPRLKQIIHCVLVNSSSLPPMLTVAQIAKSRTENLAKAMVQDLKDFEQTVVSEGLLPSAYEGDGIIPAAITLGVLNDSIIKVVAAGETVPLPQSSYPQIIALLKQVSQPSEHQVVKHVFVTKLALSLLQTCVGPFEKDLGLSQTEYQALGNTLGDIILRSMNVHESLVQSVLHFAITLTNDKPEICQAMCQSNLTDSLMTIIRSRFLHLVDTAGESQTVESEMLDSIILTLACLFNLTEHANEERRTFATSVLPDDSTNHLSRLVDIYMATAPRIDTAKTEAESSVLAPFGYLSLLICNLCLDEQLWLAVSVQLNEDYGVSDIVVSAKTLLIHLRAVENEGEDDGSGKGSVALDNVTMRFGEILSNVRLE